MAIADWLPGVEVTVHVDGQPLKEYSDPDIEEEEDKTVTRYIEATSGKNFEIHCKISKGTRVKGDALTFSVITDGNWAYNAVIEKKHFRRMDWNEFVSGPYISKNQVQKFSFSALETADDGRAFKNEFKKVQDLGCISVKIDDKLYIGPSTQGLVATISATNIVSEKAIKGRGVSHRTALSETMRAPERRVWDMKLTEPNAGFEALFKFRYRARDNLKAMRIIPSTPPLEERDVDTLSHEELLELQRRARSATVKEETQAKVKLEDADDNPRPRKRARPTEGSVLLELDDEGNFRELPTPDTNQSTAREIVELE